MFGTDRKEGVFNAGTSFRKFLLSKTAWRSINLLIVRVQNAIQYEKYKYYDQRACKKEQRGVAALFAGHVNVEGEEEKKVTFSCYLFTLYACYYRDLSSS